MKQFLLIAALSFALGAAACEQQVQRADQPEGPRMDAPTPEAEPARVFAPESENARTVTGRLTLTLTTRMPDAESAQSGPTDVLSLRTQTGLAAEATLEGTSAPSATVEGQTIRALMELPVDASQTLVYRVTEETAPGGRRLCGERETTRLVIWEPEAPGADGLRMLALAGDAPGQAGAVACGAFAYTRAE
ncbi:MAG: hypothetical protein AB7J28_03645 [Hyphomonadaceae bacterium]